MNNEDIKDIDEVLEEAKVKSDRSDTEDLPESPSSANVKMWIDGFGVMFTIRDNQMFNTVKKITTLIQLAKEKNWQPTWEVKILPKDQPAQNTPVCGVHGTAMTWLSGISKKSGKPYAFWSCKTKNADGSYCSYSPPKENV